uniref:Uncharacterized protein n=1 Tax=Leersia perrieri TaxID=77586 RepID=A0A0D9V596_9ORYZ
MRLIARVDSNRERAVQLRSRRVLLALCCSLLLLLCCCSLCHARVSPGVRSRVVRVEAGADMVVYQAGKGEEARTVALPPPAGYCSVSGKRMERLMRSVPSPGVGH